MAGAPIHGRLPVGVAFARPKVMVTPWLRRLPTALGEQTRLYTLDPAYAERVAEAGAEPLIAPHAADPARLLDGCDGLLLTGGGDVDPSSYRSEDEGALEDADPAVDAWELLLLAEARRRGVPTFGICRGMQLLAVSCGGSLDQQIATGEEHLGVGRLSAEQALALRHEISLEPGCRIARALGQTTVAVNSIHQQAVRDPGDLRVAAQGPGGVIEAVEADGWPAFGVQWHPEKMEEPLQRRLFELFVSDCVRRSTFAS